MRGLGIITLLLASVAGVADAGDLFGNGDLSVMMQSSSGDHGTGIESEARWMVLRYETGNAVRFHVDFSYVELDAGDSDLVFTGLGPVSRGGNGAGSGTGRVAQAIDRGDTTVSGAGDLRVGLSRRVVGGGVKLYRVDLSADVKLPTADEERNLGTGAWDYRAGVAGEYRFWSATAFGGLGWNRLGDTDSIVFNDVVDLYLGAESEPILGGRLIASGWVEGRQEAIDSIGSRTVLGTGVRSTGRTRWTLQARVGLSDAAEEYSLVAGVSFGAGRRAIGLPGGTR